MTEPVAGQLRQDPAFRRYWLARWLSTAGTIITYVALPVLVYRVSGSTLLTALVSSLEAVSYVMFGLVAGAVADRVDRKRLMVAADCADAVAMASIPVAHWLGILTVPHLLVAAFVVPAVAVFFDGANFGALPVLVGRARIAEANALIWSSVTAAEIVLPALVGVGLAILHPATMLAVDALSYVVSGLLVRSIARAMYDEARVSSPLRLSALGAEIGEGLRFLVGHAGVRTMTAVGTLQCIAGGGFVALLVVWCDQILDVGTSGVRFGLIFGSWSVGGLLAAAALPRVLRRARPEAITLFALPFSAVLGVVTALQTQWQLGALALFAWSCAYTLIVVNTISYRQQVTPEPLQSRVNTAGRMLAWGVGFSLGAVVAGVLSHAVGIRPALVAMASVTVLAVVLAWASPLRVRRPTLVASPAGSDS
jgi:MFS family permease